MDKLKKIAYVFNARQDKWYIVRVLKDGEIYMGIPDAESVVEYEPKEWIGFYEFLFNPKYKVFEVFEIYTISCVTLCELEKRLKIKQPQQIIDYMYESLKAEN